MSDSDLASPNSSDGAISSSSPSIGSIPSTPPTDYKFKLPPKLRTRLPDDAPTPTPESTGKRKVASTDTTPDSAKPTDCSDTPKHPTKKAKRTLTFTLPKSDLTCPTCNFAFSPVVIDVKDMTIFYCEHCSSKFLWDPVDGSYYVCKPNPLSSDSEADGECGQGICRKCAATTLAGLVAQPKIVYQFLTSLDHRQAHARLQDFTYPHPPITVLDPFCAWANGYLSQLSASSKSKNVPIVSK